MRLTRYRYNNVPMDSDGVHYYIKEENSDPGILDGNLVKRIRHLRMPSWPWLFQFYFFKNGLNADLTCFVPLKASCEINHLKLRNDSSETKSLSYFHL